MPRANWGVKIAMFRVWIPAAAAALLYAAAAHADSARRTTPLVTPTAEKPASAPVVERTTTIAATVSYPGTLAASPTFNRPNGCANLSGVGTAVSVHQQPFTVDTAGSYTLTVLNTTPAIDTVMVLYQGTFSAAAPLTNCIAFNDDAAGITPLSRITQSLTAGTPYVLVTTSFDNGALGSFNNEITGPGGISLGGGGGPSANLGLTKTAPDGVVNGGTYRYVLVASNAGPDNATGVTVTDTLPAGVSFVSSTCGATAAGQTVTWPIGALANGGSASCTLTVSRTSLTCSTVVNTASISGTQTDPNTANNTATHSNGGGEVIVDGSFEAPSAPAWTQSSTNFGSPLCDEANCGNGGGSAAPRTGTQWMWFGGAAALEVGVAEQSVAIPAGATTLSFGYRLGLCAAGAGANDFIRLTVGGTELWRRDGSSAECGAGAYALANVDISALAGGTRVVRFESTNGTASAISNFSIDDVSLLTAPVCAAPQNADISITHTVTPPPSQIVGNPVTVGLTVANAGPGPASGVTTSTALPAQLAFVSSSCGASAAGQTITWSVGALANGASASCTLNTRIAVGGAISISSSVASATADPVSANNAAAVNLAGAPVGAPRPAVVPSLNAVGLLALVLSLLAVGGLAYGRRDR